MPPVFFTFSRAEAYGRLDLTDQSPTQAPLRVPRRAGPSDAPDPSSSGVAPVDFSAVMTQDGMLNMFEEEAEE
eukprot:1192130-Prorocentrum_minimum.AAC.1